MEWWIILTITLAVLFFLACLGLPIAFAFLMVNIGLAIYLWGPMGLSQIIDNLFDTVNTFTLLPIPLFLLMGEIMVHSGISNKLIEVTDEWMGKIPGRLSIIAVVLGVIFAVLSGSGMASTAMLGRPLVPAMRDRGYSKFMSIGPIIGCGGLAALIPPSGQAVVLGAIAQISIGGLLIGGILPGLMIAVICIAFIVLLSMIKPSIAPPYETPRVSMSIKLKKLVKYLLPLGIVIFLVTGVIFLGIATPSEAAATGVVGILIVELIATGAIKFSVMKKSLISTITTSSMLLIIIAAAGVFGQVLAFSGSIKELVNLVSSLNVPPLLIIALMQFILLIMGMFMPTAAMIMISMPIFMPIVLAFHFNPVWFGIMTLLNLELAQITPPYGASLFVMKGVATPDITINDIYKAAIPYCVINIIVLAILFFFPDFTMWLPNMMISGVGT